MGLLFQRKTVNGYQIVDFTSHTPEESLLRDDDIICAWYSPSGGLCVMHGYCHCINCESYIAETNIEDISEEEYGALWDECYAKSLKSANKP
jgi:hypothetical protein